MNRPKHSKEEIDAVGKLYDTALLEFTRDGAITTARCDTCNALLQVEALSASAWRLRCPCGKYNVSVQASRLDGKARSYEA